MKAGLFDVKGRKAELRDRWNPPPETNDAALVCPHCQTAGTVSSEAVKAKKGISGSKATAAVLTAGFSIIGTGLSRKQTVARRRCAACGSVWTVE